MVLRSLLVQKQRERYTGLGQQRFLSQSEMSAFKKTSLEEDTAAPLCSTNCRRKSRGLNETKWCKDKPMSSASVCLDPTDYVNSGQKEKKRKEVIFTFCVVALLLTVDDRER